MPYYMILKVEVEKADMFPAALENVAKDVINGMPECYSTVNGNITYNFITYKNNKQEIINISDLKPK